MWIGTENGLISFDGEEFTSYTHPDLLDNDIIEISLGKDGNIMFFNLSNQLGVLKDGTIKIIFNGEQYYYDLFSSKDVDYVTEIHGQTGKLIFSIFKLVNDQIVPYLELETSVPESIIEMRQNWKHSYSSSYPTNRIYWHQDNDSIYFYKSRDRTEITNTLIRDFDFETPMNFISKSTEFGLAESKHVALLPNNQLYFVDEHVADRYKVPELQRLVVFENRCYLVFKDRLELYDFENQSSNSLLDNIVVNTVFEDRERNLWVSTRENGLIMIPNLNLEVLSFNNVDQAITDLNSDEERVTVLFGDRLKVLGKNKKQLFNHDFGTKKKVLLEKLNEDFYINGYKKLYKLNKGNQLETYKGQFLTKSRCIEIIDSTIYFGGISKMYKFSQRDSKYGIEFTEELTELFIREVNELIYSEQQDLFLAFSSRGLYKINRNETYSRYLESLNSEYISKGIESSDSSFWLATKTNGIYQIKDEEIVNHYTVSNGLNSENINDLELTENFVYAATTNGVSQINIHTGEIKNRNKGNGLPSNNIMSLTVFNDSIWLAIQKDIVIIDSSFFQSVNISPKLTFDHILVNNEVVDFEKGSKFRYDNNKIDIVLKNISLNSGSNKKLKYRIPNLDTVWTEIKEGVIRLPALQPGRYNVEAIGINAAGIESDPLKFSFVIQPPWWRTLWAGGLFAFIILGSAYLLFLYRIRREKEKRAYLTQINAIKDQALQLQMNPHFIFNSLNAIQGFIGTDEEEKAMNFLARFARLIRLIFEHSKGNSITLEEELEFMQLYLDLEKLRFKDKVKVHVRVDSELEANKDIIRVPPLLIQPIVENSFKHGLFHKKGQGTLKLDYSIDNGRMKVVVEDNGIGRKKSAELRKRGGKEHKSSGIKTTQDRIDLLNFGRALKMSGIEFLDLKDKEGEALGTRTIIYIALNEN